MTVCYWCGAKDTLADIGKELDDGKYKMVQCSKCKNAYYVPNKEKVNKPKPMTKLCNSCEYLKFCARSGIEDVGCDRYKKDMTTNEEWLHTLNTEQLAEFLFSIAYMCSYCGDEAHSTEDKIQKCHFGKCGCQRKDWEKWLKQPHIPKE